MDKVGRKKVVALVTDNASNMVLARSLLTSEKGYIHILEFRYVRARFCCCCCCCACALLCVRCCACAMLCVLPTTCVQLYHTPVKCRCSMHAFALLLVSILSHEWAADVVSNAQRIVTYFRSSAVPLQQLRDCIKQSGIKGGGLVSSNKTRFTPVHLVRALLTRLHIT